ncbi:carboxypeptidase-like regulatory domain-containing protein [[Muricauda] lutisoli]|uniref:TonB-dependent receptor n=1 Tax=[Muricauda] lutisoli TaxID=2816035 RepID=A0ABS3EWX8_9FLAO|nr:carboxypeptidase-like regulatory domain-containing protein [[Muricauda] lutisoli]MBO0330742.1 TonB-dependent receptor [[Muricauda] lutisoli]
MKQLTFLIFLCINCVFAQNIVLSGVILDNSNTPMANANILAFPNNDGESTQFAITNDMGEYILRLEKEVAYSIEVSYLGYQKLLFEYTALQNETKDLTMVPKTNDLDEVILEYKIPIAVKEDTITYQTDAFVTGEERKLREVLKKLPGIEVDREGNVTAQGKKVTKVLVEDKTFFTGNSKLAVNNIPADAVDQVQVLDNYNKIGFLKGLQDSDELALNIKLKEDKKKFTFGDMEAGGGIKDCYLAHPNLFYYSPKTNVNFIGDLNNIGVKSFSFTDYLEFNGGFGKLMDDIGGYFSLSRDDFSQFLNNTDFKANTNRFGAFNLRQTVSPKTDINSYVIANSSSTQTETNTLNSYNNSDGLLNEDRTEVNDFDNFFLIGKATVEHEPNRDENITLNTFAKLTKNKGDGIILTQSEDQNTFFNTLQDVSALELKQNVEYSKRFSRAQTLSLEASAAHQKNNPHNAWETDQVFLLGLIPLEEDNFYQVFQQKETRSTSFDLLMKDYWVLNNFNHIYTTFGANAKFDAFISDERQRLSNGTLNDFSENGFGNDIDHRFNDTFLGLEYKFLAGIFTVKSGLFYHNYIWDNDQEELSVNNSTQVLLPTFDAEAEFNSSEKIRFRYRQRMQFPTIDQLGLNFMLRSFNSVGLGVPDLQNGRNHSYSLGYYKFSLFRGLNLNLGLTYNKRTQSAKNATVLDGINQFVTYTMFNQPENSLNANFGFGKRINKVKLSIEGRGSYNEFFQLVNNNVSKNLSRSISATGKVETFFDEWPNIELGFTHKPSVYITSTNKNTFANSSIFANLDYVFFNDLHLKADYERTEYNNEGQNLTTIFDVANASLFYQQEDSPWGFEISANNLIDVRFKRQNSFSDFLISDQSTAIMPRIVMFKIIYKL